MRRGWLCLWLSLGLSGVTRAEPVPPAAVRARVSLRVIVRGLKEPVGLVFAPGDRTGRFYVVERHGRVRVVEDGRILERPFIDLSARVSTNHQERGLLGLAFHPRYADNGRIYLDFTDAHGDTRVIELTVRKGQIDPSSERELLYIKQPYANHNGGALVFGPDGALYVGTGDGGAANDPHGNSQNPRSQLGKMLRIDVDVPTPTVETVAIGLRNPWRYAFDRKTSELYIADVGQDHYEEVDVVPASSLRGKNFGWNLFEGSHCTRGKTCKAPGPTVEPVLEYTHKEGCSITGGYVYRGKALPELDGIYFYADYCTALLRSFRLVAGRAEDRWDWRPVLDPESKLAQLSTFAEDPDGELYLVSLEGVIWKFTPR